MLKQTQLCFDWATEPQCLHFPK